MPTFSDIMLLLELFIILYCLPYHKKVASSSNKLMITLSNNYHTNSLINEKKFKYYISWFLIFQIFIPEMSDLISSNIREQKCKSVIAEFYYYHRKSTICYTRVFVIEKQLNTMTMADQ